MNREYLETARLLIQVAPLVFVDDQFGLERQGRCAFSNTNHPTVRGDE